MEGITSMIKGCLPIGFIFTTAYWFTFREIMIRYHKRYPDYDFSIERILYIVISCGFWYLIVKFAIGFLVHNLFNEYSILEKENMLATQISTMIVIMMVFFLYEGIYYFNKSRIIQIEKNRLEKVTAEQKLDTLKNQVNPHFLFNSLNTLVTIIPDDPKMAINFVQNLSTTYRNILEFRDEKLIPIRQELVALESYIYLLKTRFHGKVHIYNNIKDEVKEDFILPISLQILIENAVKHNITSKNKPLKIELDSNSTHITVKNNLQRKNQNYSSTKLGLANISSRYNLLVDEDIHVIENEDSFIVKLPIIKNKLNENSHR